jgi:hypothetical protein
MPEKVSTAQNIDSIVYGDLLLIDKQKISCSDRIISYFFVTGLINSFLDMAPPSNSSQQTINELLFLERVTANATDEDIKFSTKAEVTEKKVYEDFCNRVLNLNYTEDDFIKLFDQVDPILMLLKQHYNRPRPYQLAPYFNIQIMFKVPVDAMHPAYPSGHALDAYIFANIFKKLKPEFSEKIEALANKMAESRFIAGTHYPSDNIISKKLADTLVAHNLIKLPKKV